MSRQLMRRRPVSCNNISIYVTVIEHVCFHATSLRRDECTCIDFYSIHIRAKRRRTEGQGPFFRRSIVEVTDCPVSSALSFIRIWCLGQRHYISWAIDRPKFCPSFAPRRYRRRNAHFFSRLIFRRARHININSMYEICQNEFRLGAAAPGPPFFFPRRMRSWCEISLYYCAGTWGVSGRSIPASAFSR